LEEDNPISFAASLFISCLSYRRDCSVKPILAESLKTDLTRLNLIRPTIVPLIMQMCRVKVLLVNNVDTPPSKKLYDVILFGKEAP